MSLNYHELTLNEPRDSPARRKQFLVICSVMASALVYTAITSGIFLSIDATESTFPGGNYCYKFATRDYAASNGQGRRITEDWALATTPSEEKDDWVKLEGEEKDEFKRRKKLVDNKLYSVFLDNPMKMGGTRQRYMTGLLVSDAGKAEYCEPLMTLNPKIEKTKAKFKKIAFEDKNTGEIYQETPYESVELPSVKSLVVQFPFTNGFVSALIFSYKILPAMRKMVIEKGGPDNYPVIISQCDKKQEMCTHYAPLVQGSDFLVGKPPMEEHLEALGPESFLDWEHLKGGARRIAPASMKKYFDEL